MRVDRLYYKQVKKQIPAALSVRKDILRQLHTELRIYMEEHLDAVMDDIIRDMGSPQELAASLLETYNVSALVKNEKRTHTYVTIVAAVLTVLCICFFAFMLSQFISLRQDAAAYYCTEIWQKPIESTEVSE